MPSHSRSRRSQKGYSSTSSSSDRGSRIRTVDVDRPYQRYASNPEDDDDIPLFTRTSAYYETRARDPNYRYFDAGDVRRQVREAPSGDYTEGAYPRIYTNDRPSPLRLRAQPPYREFPLVPNTYYSSSSSPSSSPSSSFSSSSSRGSGGGSGYRSDIHRPGPVRAFYNDEDRSSFDVGYRDSSRSASRTAGGGSFYNLAVYHPAPTFSYVRHR